MPVDAMLHGQYGVQKGSKVTSGCYLRLQRILEFINLCTFLLSRAQLTDNYGTALSILAQYYLPIRLSNAYL